MSFPGLPGGGAGGRAGDTAGMSDQEAATVKAVRSPSTASISFNAPTNESIFQMQAAMESCPAKSVISGGMGFGLGAMFGLFMSSVRLVPINPITG